MLVPIQPNGDHPRRASQALKTTCGTRARPEIPPHLGDCAPGERTVRAAVLAHFGSAPRRRCRRRRRAVAADRSSCLRPGERRARAPSDRRRRGSGRPLASSSPCRPDQPSAPAGRPCVPALLPDPGVCRYVPVCAGMCRYVPVCAGMCRYVPVCAGSQWPPAASPARILPSLSPGPQAGFFCRWNPCGPGGNPESGRQLQPGAGILGPHVADRRADALIG